MVLISLLIRHASFCAIFVLHETLFSCFSASVLIRFFCKPVTDLSFASAL